MGVFSFGMFILALCTTIISAAASPALLLSPLIKKNNPEEAKKLSSVNSSYFLNVTSYSGYLTVEETFNSNLFFWFFPARNKSLEKTPWIIWLQGGPGASGLAGLFNEMGPFEYDKELKLRESTWTEEFSMLFFDNPVGAGFSFTNSHKGFVRNMTTCSNQLYSAIQQFLTMFPELRSAPLYLAGESYAGRYIPALGLQMEHNKSSKNETINLKGLIMGNPVTNREDIEDYTAAYYHWGLIDSQMAFALKPLQDSYNTMIKTKNEAAAYELRNQLLNKLDDVAALQQNFNILEDEPDLKKFINFVTRPEIREALHVGEDISFTFSNASVHTWLIPDFLNDVRPKIETLLEHYRVLIYCGQMDLSAPCVPNALARRKTWTWSGRRQFLAAARTPWWFNESVAGYVKSGGGLTEVLVRGAGHLVPMDKPAQAQQLISYFIRGLDLPLPTNYKTDFVQSLDIPESYYVGSIVPSDNAADSSNNGALTASIVINVVLVLGILLAAVLFIRWKRRNEAFFYTTTDSITDGILSMS